MIGENGRVVVQIKLTTTQIFVEITNTRFVSYLYHTTDASHGE